MSHSKTHLTLALALSATLFSCAPTSLPTASGPVPAVNRSIIGSPQNDSPAQSTRNTSPKFAQSASIKGKITLPFIVTPTQIASTEFSLMAYFTGLPAHAQEETEETAVTAEDLETLQATVNGESVEIEITDLETNPATDETVISYEIDEAPVSEGNDVIEIQTEDGTPVLGAITDLEENQTTEQNIDEETTSILNTATEIHGSTKIGDLTIADLAALAVNPKFLQLKASLRSILKKDGTFKHNKKAKLQQQPCTQPDDDQDDFETLSNNKSKGKSAKEKDKKEKKQDKHEAKEKHEKSESKSDSHKSKYAPCADTSTDDTSTDDTSTDDTTTDDTTTDDTTTDDTTTDDTTTDNANTDATPAA